MQWIGFCRIPGTFDVRSPLNRRSPDAEPSFPVKTDVRSVSHILDSLLSLGNSHHYWATSDPAMASQTLQCRLSQLLHTIRGVRLDEDTWASIQDGDRRSPPHPLAVCSALSDHLRQKGFEKESDVLQQTLSIATTRTSLGGMALSRAKELSTDEVDELLLLISACTQRPSVLPHLLCLPVPPESSTRGARRLTEHWPHQGWSR